PRFARLAQVYQARRSRDWVRLVCCRASSWVSARARRLRVTSPNIQSSSSLPSCTVTTSSCTVTTSRIWLDLRIGFAFGLPGAYHKGAPRQCPQADIYALVCYTGVLIRRDNVGHQVSASEPPSSGGRRRQLPERQIDTGGT